MVVGGSGASRWALKYAWATDVWHDEPDHIPLLKGRQQAVGVMCVLEGFACSLWDACTCARAGRWRRRLRQVHKQVLGFCTG